MSSKRKLTGAFVRSKLDSLIKNPNESAVRASLAKLRRGIGKSPGSLPELWNLTLDGMPEELMGKQSNATYGEWAAYTALTLFALHQQGKDLKGQCMNQNGSVLGGAVRRLIQSEDDEDRIKRRFDTVITAGSLVELAHHMRGLIQLLKEKSISLDYPAFAEDLFCYQIPVLRDGVRLRWGRDYYRKSRKDENNENKQ